MLEQLPPMVPRDVVNISLVLALAFFIGLEREEHKQRELGYAFGGVRTYPLIGLSSYALAMLSSASLLPWTAGLVVVGALMWLSYRHKLEREPPGGLTTEMTALATYVVGALVQRELYWVATTIGVVSVILLELKKGLEGLTRYAASDEIITVAKFLVLAAVILPVLPNHALTRFAINPFDTWLVVVAVSGVSFASYVLQRVLEQRGGVFLSALLGGAYSSTVTTVVLARQAKQELQPNLFAAATVTASAVMYVRLLVLLSFFDHALALSLLPAFGGLAFMGLALGGAVYLRHQRRVDEPAPQPSTRNPLELRAAFLFAAVFVFVLILTKLASEYLGQTGLYALAAIMGVTDVDPFILGLSQGHSGQVPTDVAAAAIVIASASNNGVKALYAYGFADRATGRRSFALLIALAALGMLPLIWL